MINAWIISFKYCIYVRLIMVMNDVYIRFNKNSKMKGCYMEDQN